jgi:asparagine synthase (glutamine-hydrolysing)
MAGAIRHRGPDGHGFYAGRTVGFAHVALKAIDADVQPLTNEDGTMVLAADAQIFNHPELRRELEERGHVFRTRCHAEVLIHGYEEWGPALLARLDGQFAFAVYDRNSETVLVARDRFGVRPLFYAQRSGDFYIGSEIKAILAGGEVDAALDPRGLDEVLRCGAARPPRTVFSGIASLEPGTYGVWRDGALWLRHYYELDYPESAEEPPDAVEQLDEIMLRSAGMRLRASVPVGAFVSGGLDSSITASLARSASSHPLRSFSISFAIPEYDESLRQAEVAAAVSSTHTGAVIEMDTIAQTLPEVLWHAETPLLSTGPALMFHLARLTRESGVKVIVGGEGSDEIFLGNEVFRESSVRRFCSRRPDSSARRMLFNRVYRDPGTGFPPETWQSLVECAVGRDPLFSHLPRFMAAEIGEVYHPEFRAALGGIDVIAELRSALPTRFFGWSSLNQAAYLEMTTQFSPYALSSHADRMTMAHGVEARYPFLDHRVFEFVSSLPTGSRLRGLRGKDILRRWASRILPTEVVRTTARATRPPEAQALFLAGSPSWIGDQLTSEALRRVGVFSPAAVGGLVTRHRAGLARGREENSTLIGVLSTQLWHQQFVESALLVTPLSAVDASVMLGDDAAGSHRIPATTSHVDVS